MAKAEAIVEELVAMIERGELRLPEMQRQYVWRSTRVRDLLDSLYRGYPSGAILLWETDEAIPLQAFAVSQEASPYKSTRLLLDGQQRLTSLSAVVRGQPITVRGRKRPIGVGSIEPTQAGPTAWRPRAGFGKARRVRRVSEGQTVIPSISHTFGAFSSPSNRPPAPDTRPPRRHGQ